MDLPSSISIKSILDRNGIPQPETEAILEELSALAYAEEVFG